MAKMLKIEKRTYDYSDTQYFAVIAMEPETDKQMQNRIEIEEKYEEVNDAREYAEFERLSKKFEGI